MTIRRKDLVDIADDNYQQRKSEFMQCQECGFGFGGTRGDYFTRDMDYIFTCDECDSDNIALVKKVVTIVKVNP